MTAGKWTHLWHPSSSSPRQKQPNEMDDHQNLFRLSIKNHSARSSVQSDRHGLSIEHADHGASFDPAERSGDRFGITGIPRPDPGAAAAASPVHFITWSLPTASGGQRERRTGRHSLPQRDITGILAAIDDDLHHDGQASLHAGTDCQVPLCSSDDGPESLHRSHRRLHAGSERQRHEALAVPSE